MRSRIRGTALIATVGLVVVLGACSASKGTTGSAQPRAGSGSSASTVGSTVASNDPKGGAADPNAPEQNTSGDIPDTQAYVLYTPPVGGYAVKVPEGWARTDTAGTIVFTDKLNSIRMETTPAAAAPTVDSARRDEVPAVAKASTKYEPGKVTALKRKAGAVVLITYRADGTPNEVTGKPLHLDVERYEFWRNGTEVILTLSGPQGADNVDPWKIVTDSFTWA